MEDIGGGNVAPYAFVEVYLRFFGTWFSNLHGINKQNKESSYSCEISISFHGITRQVCRILLVVRNSNPTASLWSCILQWFTKYFLAKRWRKIVENTKRHSALFPPISKEHPHIILGKKHVWYRSLLNTETHFTPFSLLMDIIKLE